MVEKQQRSGDPGGSGGGGLNSRILMSGRTGAILMKSVSIFLASGRKASGGSKKQSSSENLLQQEGRRRKKKMPEDPSLKSAAYQARLIESLKKKTKFNK